MRCLQWRRSPKVRGSVSVLDLTTYRWTLLAYPAMRDIGGLVYFRLRERPHVLLAIGDAGIIFRADQGDPGDEDDGKICCPHGDLACPCPDGAACHYEDIGDTDKWKFNNGKDNDDG